MHRREGAFSHRAAVSHWRFCTRDVTVEFLRTRGDAELGHAVLRMRSAVKLLPASLVALIVRYKYKADKTLDVGVMTRWRVTAAGILPPSLISSLLGPTLPSTWLGQEVAGELAHALSYLNTMLQALRLRVRDPMRRMNLFQFTQSVRPH
jgi:hypothetical protein